MGDKLPQFQPIPGATDERGNPYYAVALTRDQHREMTESGQMWHGANLANRPEPTLRERAQATPLAVLGAVNNAVITLTGEKKRNEELWERIERDSPEARQVQVIIATRDDKGKFIPNYTFKGEPQNGQLPIRHMEFNDGVSHEGMFVQEGQMAIRLGANGQPSVQDAAALLSQGQGIVAEKQAQNRAFHDMLQRQQPAYDLGENNPYLPPPMTAPLQPAQGQQQTGAQPQPQGRGRR